MVVWRTDTELPVPERRPHTHPSRREPMPQNSDDPPKPATFRESVKVLKLHGLGARRLVLVGNARLKTALSMYCFACTASPRTTCTKLHHKAQRKKPTPT